MRALLNVNNHTFSIENKVLIVDGVLLDIKLKSAFFGTSSNKIGNKKWEIKIGKNTFIIDDKGFNVNGQTYLYSNIDKLKQKNGVVPPSQKPYLYKFADVQINFVSGAKKETEVKPSKPTNKRFVFNLFKIGDVTQVGSVKNYPSNKPDKENKTDETTSNL